MNDKKGVPAALVTGSTAGIGAAIALCLAEEGYRVILSGRREEAAVTELMDRIRGASGRRDACLYIRGDIAEESTRVALKEAVEKNFSSLAVLVNNAGITTAGRKDILELEIDEMERVFRVNLTAPFMLTKELVPSLAASTERSYVINISSLSSYTVSVNRADYCVSKAAVSMMTALFAGRLAGMNIGVFEIRPGIIATDMTAPVREKYDAMIDGGLLPLARWGTPEDVAKAVAAIVNGAFPYSTGEIFNIDGGFHIRRL